MSLVCGTVLSRELVIRRRRLVFADIQCQNLRHRVFASLSEIFGTFIQTSEEAMRRFTFSLFFPLLLASIVAYAHKSGISRFDKRDLGHAIGDPTQAAPTGHDALTSTDCPTNPCAPQASYSGNIDGFVVKGFETKGTLAPPLTPTPNPSPIQLILDESGPDPDQVAALDSVLFLRDPFPIMNSANLLNQESDKNTKVVIFVTNLQLAQGEPSSAVVVNLIDSNNQSHDLAAEDVRPVPTFAFAQVIFRLPDGLAAGTCRVRVTAHGQVSNAGTVRVGVAQNFSDEFSTPGDRLNRSVWTTEIGPGSFLGRTQLRDWITGGGVGRFFVANGNAQLALDTFNPTGFSLYGTHAKTRSSFQPSPTTDVVLAVRMRLTTLQRGIVFGVYFYRCGAACSSDHDEIDIEVVTNYLQPGVSPLKVQLNRYAAEPLGAGHGPIVNLPAGFDPLAYHEWKIRWGTSRLTYYVDSVELFSTTTFVPQRPMHADMIAWGPASDWSAAYDASLQPTNSQNANQSFYALVDYFTVKTVPVFADSVLFKEHPGGPVYDRGLSPPVLHGREPDRKLGWYWVRNQRQPSTKSVRRNVP